MNTQTFHVAAIWWALDTQMKKKIGIYVENKSQGIHYQSQKKLILQQYFVPVTLFV